MNHILHGTMTCAVDFVEYRSGRLADKITPSFHLRNPLSLDSQRIIDRKLNLRVNLRNSKSAEPFAFFSIYDAFASLPSFLITSRTNALIIKILYRRTVAGGGARNSERHASTPRRSRPAVVFVS